MERPDNAKTEQSAKQLLRVIHNLRCELTEQPSSTELPGLDSDLTHDLGLDSLSRAELIHRTEKEFDIALPDQILATIETPRDLLKEILNASGSPDINSLSRQVEHLKLDAVDSLPDQAETLQQVLDWHVKTHPKRPHLYIYERADRFSQLSYQELKQSADETATGLINLGIEPGDCVAIMLPTCKDYFCSFFGVLFARAIPVPIYPPANASHIEDHLNRHASILQNAQVKLMISAPEASSLSRLLRLQVPTMKAVVTAQELLGVTSHPDTGKAKGSDIAFLQYTSGSTGTPKGVSLTHKNLLANIRAMGKVVGAGPDDVFVSWLPVYHDMGLIGAWFGSLYHAMPLVIMSPLVFLSKPQRWLWAIHRHKGTLSPAPNFAYELCISKIEEQELQGLDLSSWRLSWNGAEPVSPSTIQRFYNRFSVYGFSQETMSPVYGLAESSVGLTFPDKVRKPRVESFQREQLSAKGRAVPAEYDDSDAVHMVGLGVPLPGHEIRIVDAVGKELPEGEEGELEFKGPSATQGYYRDSAKTEALYHGEWLRSGDRGFTLNSELFLTGRSKDIIIRAGRNIYPHELEESVGKIPGIRKGCIAAFACHDHKRGTERLVLLAETREKDKEKHRSFREQINKLSVELLGSPVDEIVICAPHTVPKTSSGKVRRSACRELYEQGLLENRERAVWIQLAHLAIAGAVPELKRLWRTATDLGYALWMWLNLAFFAPVIWILVALIPDRDWGWTVTRLGARFLIWITRTKINVSGRENLPSEKTACILVANHCSYLDGLVLVAMTPVKCRFVAKAELQGNFFARIFLSRLGTEFVERFDVEKGVADASRVTLLAKECVTSGKTEPPLFIFPEGTFYRMPGLHDFHLGAFVAAVQAKLPVIPITLLGTRSKLRGDSLLPRRGDISIEVCKPQFPQGTGWSSANLLKNRVRNEILRHCGEPDLAEH